jgi:hypothetical protein
MKNKLKKLNESSRNHTKLKNRFEDLLEQKIKQELNIDLSVCYHVEAFSIYESTRNINVCFSCITNKWENNSKTGYIKISQKIIKLINNLFK